VSGSLGLIDWGVIALYAMGVVGVAVWSARRTSEDHDPFLAGRKVSPLLVAMSLVATALSGATFLGGPEQSYRGDLTYLIGQVAEVIAIVLVAFVFLPRYYKARVTTVYEIIGARYGGGAQRTVSGVFMMGRVLASGSRLFLAALAVALILFGTSQSFWAVLGAVVIISVVACAYTLTGGIRAVIWTDAAQLCVLLLGAGVAIWILLGRIPLSTGELVQVLRTPDPETGQAKATIVARGFDLSVDFSLWSALTGLLLFNLAAFGTDQDLMQRMLTCSSKGKAAASALLSKVIGFGAVAVFLTLGLLLWVYYQRPDVMGDAAPAVAPVAGVEVFLGFILQDLPVGVRGLVVAGLFAAAMSTMDSTLNALSTTSVCDFYNRWRPNATPRDRERVSKWFVFIWASALSGFALVCLPLQKLSGDTLLVFVLGVMLYAYTGMLAVFLTAMFTKRGSAGSVVAALATGFVSVGLMQWGPVVYNAYAARSGIELTELSISLGWRMLFGTVAAFAVCVSVRGGDTGERTRG
jgi:SSS family transporter